MKTLDTFAQEMADEAGEDYTDAQVAALFKQWAIEAYVTTAASSRFLWMNQSFSIVTANGTAEYTLDPTVTEVKMIRNTSTDAVIGYNTEESLARLSIDFEEQAAPKYWFYSGIDANTTALKIQFVPVPDGAYTLDVRTHVRPTTLGDSTVIPLPTEFVENMRNFVRAQYQYNDDRIQLAGQSMQIFQQTLIAYVTRYTAPRTAVSRLRIKNKQGTNQGLAASVE